MVESDLMSSVLAKLVFDKPLSPGLLVSYRLPEVDRPDLAPAGRVASRARRG
jgi:hypothetical protein